MTSHFDHVIGFENLYTQIRDLSTVFKEAIWDLVYSDEFLARGEFREKSDCCFQEIGKQRTLSFHRKSKPWIGELEQKIIIGLTCSGELSEHSVVNPTISLK